MKSFFEAAIPTIPSSHAFNLGWDHNFGTKVTRIVRSVRKGPDFRVVPMCFECPSFSKTVTFSLPNSNLPNSFQLSHRRTVALFRPHRVRSQFRD